MFEFQNEQYDTNNSLSRSGGWSLIVWREQLTENDFQSCIFSELERNKPVKKKNMNNYN